MVNWETLRTDDLTVAEDDVDMGVIVLPVGQSSVTEIETSVESDGAIYNLAGQRMRGDLSTLPQGIYIVGGKKVVK